MKKILSLFQVLYTIYAFLLFTAFLLLIFPLVLAASLFGKLKGGNFIYMLCQLWADTLFPFFLMHHTNYFEVPHDRNRQYVFVFNHISFIDIPIIMKAIRKQHFRILGKAELGKVPIFGFLYRKAVVMVDRSSPANRAQSVRQLKSVISKGISVVISPEGTFNMTHHPLKEFYDGAFRVAIETQTPIKPILFLDAWDRLRYDSIFSLTPGRSRAVYLDEISVKGLTLDDTKMLKEKVYKIMEEKLIHYKAGWIKPTDS
ncbi:MAG: 1-acyl-sn-glycerol-3-phosphate acyltransferase [Chitinophagaceae bacterium]|nr:1-acyl-sn-glycerol-3-phosphate acyltransferase [Chitinophagaceae bacterium]